MNFETYKKWQTENQFWSSTNTRFTPFSEFKKKVESYTDIAKISSLGKSEKGKNIYQLTLGEGPKRVIIWSQMHGNETTGTLAIFDILDYLKSNKNSQTEIFENFTIAIVCMVNPDGAEAFERRNSLGIDLNRDAVAQQAVETKLLMKAINNFKPDIAFNLHDQRTLFSVGKEINPATISFLIPSFNQEKTINETRRAGMSLVASVWRSFPNEYQQNTGRYIDDFYPTAFGDNIQKTGINCVLIEAGAAFQDPKRNEARLLVGFSLLNFLRILKEEVHHDYEEYFQIPQNEQRLRDIIVKGIKLKNKRKPVLVDVAFKLEETTEKGKFKRSLLVEDIGDLSQFRAYQEVNGNGLEFSSNDIFIGKKLTFQEFQHIFWEGVII